MIKQFEKLVALVQKCSGGRNPATGQELETPQIADDLNPGASETKLKDLEEKIGFNLPDDLRELLAKYDGQAGKGPPALGQYTFCSIERMLEHYWAHESIPYRENKAEATDPRIRPVMFWHAGWMPFGTWETQQLIVDLSPSDEGTEGQIHILENGMAPGPVIAPGLNEFIKITFDKLTDDPDFFFHYEKFE